MTTELLDAIEYETLPNPTIAVIWMHGLGDSGHGFAPIAKELNLHGLAGIRFVFPHAPTMPVTINGGYVMRAWYDIISTDLVRIEDEKGIRASQVQIDQLIAREMARGIAAERIVIAGFSQGCAMTLQTALRYPQKLAGLLCLSGYVPLHQMLAAQRHAANNATPIFLAHGRADSVIPISRAIQSRDLLISLGYEVEWHEYPMQHSVCEDEIVDMGNWLRSVFLNEQKS